MNHVKPRLFCKDGTSLSLQASEYHYCTPRDNSGPYSHMEIGFVLDENSNPTPLPEEFDIYADDLAENRISSVYGYVPVELIESFIESHGGRME